MKHLNSIILISILGLFASTAGLAQESGGPDSRAAQFTFIYPLGSNGVNSASYSNHFSLNALIGINGGVKGAEIGGLLNYNHHEVVGGQIAGIANINRTSSTGVMISGVYNHAGADFSGFQLGVINLAGKLKGVQLGVINIVGEAEKGIPIGLINVVKNGHYEFEVTAGEVIYGNLNFKMGVKSFYTIFKAGYSSYNNNPVLSSGIGFGGKIPLAQRHSMEVDVTSSKIIYNSDWTNGDTNFLSKLDLNYKFGMTEHFSLMAGPSFNVYVSEVRVNDEFGTLNLPNTLYTSETDQRKTSLWLGFNAGIAITI